MDGTALYEAVAAIFMAQYEGLNLNFGDYIVIRFENYLVIKNHYKLIFKNIL